VCREGSASGIIRGVDTLRLAIVRLSIGDMPAEELPNLAADALGRGIDSPSLRRLAGTPRDDVREARDLFVEAMSELGVTLPPETDGRRALVLFWAREMVDGSLSPYQTSRLIWWEGWEKLGRPDDLTVFVGLASEWEDHPDDRGELEQEMLTAAQALLDRA
jgi:hypothetical protein